MTILFKLIKDHIVVIVEEGELRIRIDILGKVVYLKVEKQMQGLSRLFK